MWRAKIVHFFCSNTSILCCVAFKKDMTFKTFFLQIFFKNDFFLKTKIWRVESFSHTWKIKITLFVLFSVTHFLRIPSQKQLLAHFFQFSRGKPLLNWKKPSLIKLAAKRQSGCYDSSFPRIQGALTTKTV